MGWFGYLLLIAFFIGGYAWIGAVALAAFFAVGGWPFWVLFGLAVGAAWFIEERHEEGALALIPFGVFCLVVHFVSQFNLIDWGRENLAYIATRGGAYLALGFGYSMFRWVLHLHKKAGEVDSWEKQFRQQEGYTMALDRANDSIRIKFANYLKNKYNPDLPSQDRPRTAYDPQVNGVVPQFGRNALTNFRRFWWWPFSLLGWFLNDLFREVWEGIRNLMQKVADGIAGLVFGRRANYVLTNAQVAAGNHRPPPPAAGSVGEEYDDGEPGDPRVVYGTRRT